MNRKPQKSKPTIRKIEKKINILKGKHRKTPFFEKEKIESVSRKLADLEKEKKEIIASDNMKKVVRSGVFKKIKDSTKAGSIFSLPDGKKVVRSVSFVATGRPNVFADPELVRYSVSSSELQRFVESGDYILIMKNAENESLPVAFPVLWKDIQKARDQRFRLLEFSTMNKKGVEVLQSSLIRSAVTIDQRIKAPKTIIKKYKDSFMDSRHPETIAKDLLFLCKIF